MTEQSVPMRRGMSMNEERDPEGKKYSAASYAAQYGITIEDAEEICDTTTSHGEAKRAITQMFANDPELRKMAMFID